MSWADSATDGGYGGGNSPGSGSGSSSGNGGYSNHGFGGQVDTGGVKGGSGSASGNSGYGGTFGDNLDATPSGRSVSAGNSRTASKSNPSSVSGGFMSEVATTGVTSGAVTGMSVESAEEEAAKTFGVEKPSVPSAESISPQALDAALTTANFVGMVNENAKPGMVGTAVNAVASAVPGLGLVSKAINAGLSAQKATKDISTINDNFGTQQDDSLSTSMRSQALGTATGTLGSKVGSSFGATVGSTVAGPIGGLVGALAGGVLGGDLGRTAGVNASTGNTGNTPGEGSGSAGDRMDGMGSDGYSMTPQVASNGDGSDYNGVVDFDGYASYAAEFFNNLT